MSGKCEGMVALVTGASQGGKRHRSRGHASPRRAQRSGSRPVPKRDSSGRER